MEKVVVGVLSISLQTSTLKMAYQDRDTLQYSITVNFQAAIDQLLKQWNLTMVTRD